MNYCMYCKQFNEPGVHKCYVQKIRDKKKPGAPEIENEDIEYLLGEYEAEHGYEDDNMDAEGNIVEPKDRKTYFCDIVAEPNENHDPIKFCMVDEDGAIECDYYGEDCLDKFLELINNYDKYMNANYMFHNLSGLVILLNC